jgi:hypothetical protein
MKINNLTFILLLGVIISGLMVAGYVSVQDKEEASRLGSHNQAQTSESYAAASISKGTILLLLAVGVIGALGVSRTKNNTRSPAQRNAIHRASDYENANEERQKLIIKSS